MAGLLHVLFVVLMVPSVAMEIDLCNLTITDIPMESLFSLNEEPIKTVFKYVVVNVPDFTECIFNTTEFWNSFGPTDAPLIGMASLECSTRARVHMLPHEGERHDSIIAHIQIGQSDAYPSSCNTTLRDMNNLAGGVDLRELTIVNGCTYQQDSNIANEKEDGSVFTMLLDHTDYVCDNLVNLGSLTIVDSKVMPERIIEEFSCSNVYTHMAEIRLKDLSWIFDDYSHIAGIRLEPWDAFWDKIRKLFPNLQSLSLPNNNLDRYPDTFPWTNSRYQLPRNLSRTKYTDDKNVRPYYLQIPAHNYMRVYNLDNNKIRDLTNFGLHGCLDMITMIISEIRIIDEQVFENVSCLQSLRLGYNQIRELPLKVFRNMIHLHELDLSHNVIESLNETIFDNLVELEILNLAQNSLEFLPPGLFTKLGRLQYIHLESNMLRSLDSQSFPTKSLAFEKLFVDGNYITAVPGFVFTTTGLVHISLSHNDISDILPNSMDGITSLRKQKSMVLSDNDLDEGAQFLTTIDLSNNQVELINSTNQTRAIWTFVLQHFRIILTDNPLNCDCRINDIASLMRESLDIGKMLVRDHRFSDWKCMHPPELQGRALMNIKINETYCVAQDLPCPSECKCYQRSNKQSTIVDCRSMHLKGEIHDQMPEGPLELWYSDNCISEIPTYSPESYMDRVIALNVSNNKVKRLSEELIELAQNVESLDLRNNTLANLPKSISKLRKLKWVSFTGNDLKCNCHSKPMKKWVMENKDIIHNWDRLICISGKEIKSLAETTDEDFQCAVDSTDYKPLYLASAAMIISVIVVICFLFRLECKVLLYMYFGLHPFDRKEEIMKEVIDCVIVHSDIDTNWVMKNIVEHLESQAYRFIIFDSKRDFLIGYSIHENLTNIVRHSKRIIICLSANWNPSNLEFKLVWNSAVKKIKETRSNYGIVICKDVPKTTIKDKSICKYIKPDRFISSTERLFIPKLVYAMPKRCKANQSRHCDARETLEHTYPNVHLQIYPTLFEKLAEETAERQADEYDVFISNSRDNDEFVFSTLRKKLESHGYKLCIPERDFLGGPTKEESILTAIYRSRRTLLILSRIHWNDEWSLFTYKKAYERSLQEKNNHLMVVISDDDIDIEDEEIKCYLNGHVTLNVNDTFFYNKLFSGLPILQKGRSVSITLNIEEDGIDNKCYIQDGGLLDNDELAETHING